MVFTNLRAQVKNQPMSEDRKAVWIPDEEFVQSSNLNAFMHWLLEKEYIHRPFDSYEDFWQWSVDELNLFWKSIAEYYGLWTQVDEKQVLSSMEMPGAKWFQGLEVNYGEQMLNAIGDEDIALISKSETRPLSHMNGRELKEKVAAMQRYLKECGVQKGDRVVAFTSNIPEASIAFIACISLGAIWSSCSPDFGVDSVLERFEQIEPKVMIAVDGYSYNGKNYDKLNVLEKICDRLPSLKRIVVIPFYNGEKRPLGIEHADYWTEIDFDGSSEPEFIPLPFDHPIWVLYSSGTTGAPKAITHSQGGVLIEHLKYIHLQNNVKAGEHFFWFSTTGWMMWNFVHASMLAGAAVVLYDGSAAYPNLNAMWEFVEETEIAHFGTSAPFLVACMKKGLQPGKNLDLSALKSIGSTGSPLPPEAFKWVYESVKDKVWLCSMSGGTDVCTAFVGSSPWKPVHIGEIQCRALGCDLHSYSDSGEPVINEVGEMVISSPMPSMPVFFWNDKDGSRYKSSYFEHFPGRWRHGDWVKITKEGSLIIYGRSDATLNRQGVRIGTAEIYRALIQIPSVKDGLIVNLELPNGDHYMPLFVLMNEGHSLNEDLKKEIKATLRKTYTPRHVPDEIIEAPDLPYTISGKKMEAPVKRILRGDSVEKSVNKGAMKNPESIDFFVRFSRGQKSL